MKCSSYDPTKGMTFGLTPEEKKERKGVRCDQYASVEVLPMPNSGKVEIIIRDTEERKYTGANPQQVRPYTRLVRWELEADTAELLARLISSAVDKVEAGS